MGTPELSGQPEQILPELRQVINQLDISRATTDGGLLVDLQLRYADADVRIAAEGALADNLEAIGQVYIEEIGQFLGSDLEHGTPMALDRHERGGDDTLDIYFDVGDESHIQESHEKTHETLANWLVAASRHGSPDALTKFVDQLLKTVSEKFNPEDFRLAPMHLERERQAERFVRDTRKLALAIARDVASYAGDISVVEAYLDSPLMEEYGNQEAIAVLEGGRARLATLNDPTEAGAYYEVAADAVYDAFLAGVDVSKLESLMQEIAKHAPDALAGVAEQYPRAQDTIYGLLRGKYDLPDDWPKSPTDRLMMEIGEKAPSADQLTELLSLLRARKFGSQPEEATTLLGTYLSDAELLATAHSNPILLRPSDPYGFVLQRLVGLGEVTLACDVADALAGEAYPPFEATAAEALLAIYAATGDEAAWQRAMQKDLTSDLELEYRRAVAGVAAATQQGDEGRAATAAAQLSTVEAGLSEYGLRAALRGALDTFSYYHRLPDAEQRAAQLLTMTQTVSVSHVEVHNIMYRIIEAYSQAGDQLAAINAISNHLCSERLYPATLVKALETVLPKTAGQSPRAAV
ncbi:MAG TPA: hypothetical protein VLE99_01365 [Candidatus Saccharimonadales bacterium]|nr:hypothetical protein [Candidatus Saccharimonadales bacterium]